MEVDTNNNNYNNKLRNSIYLIAVGITSVILYVFRFDKQATKHKYKYKKISRFIKQK
jgi:hypothetical protein